MFLWWSSYKIVQAIWIRQKHGCQGGGGVGGGGGGAGLIFPIYLYRKFKKPSYQRPLERLQYNVAEMFLWWSSTKIVQAIWIRQKHGCQAGGGGGGAGGGGGVELIFPIYLYRKLEKIFLSETTGPISIYLGRNVSLVTLYQDCSSRHDLSKNLGRQGAGLIFPIYIYIENLKKSSCQKPLDRFQYNLAGMFPWLTLYQDCSSYHDLSKNMADRGRGLFSLYIYIENFNDLLVRNHWTDFSLTLQKWFLCNPLSRLCKPSWFIKKQGRQGAGLIFPIYLYRKSLLFRNHRSSFITTWQKCFLGDPLPRLFK